MVDDDPDVIKVVKASLQLEGFRVTGVADGFRAVDLVRDEPPALVILDVMMPGMGGFEVCQQIRGFSDIPIVMLTAMGGENDIVHGLNLGADDYVAKPFNPGELAARVKAVLRRAKPGSAAAPEPPRAPVGLPFAVDETRCLVSYFGQPLDLSRYEYKLILTLVKHPGWVFSREKLMDLVWDVPESSLERTVDTHVKTIRGKLRAIRPDIEAIVTHRGLGYSLKEDW